MKCCRMLLPPQIGRKCCSARTAASNAMRVGEVEGMKRCLYIKKSTEKTHFGGDK